MNFQDFLKYVPKIREVSLPEKEAHIKMLPMSRLEIFQNQDLDSINAKTAAIMMLFYPKMEKTHLVLIVRNSYDGVHSAQIAFPGGKYEDEDQSYKTTALRETQEEIGIHQDKIEVVRAFSQLYIQPSNFLVHPFLGICKEEIVFVPDPNEVTQIIELPLTHFLNDNLIITTTLSTSYLKNIEVPAFNIDGQIVWGATAMMLSELKEVLKKVL